MRPQERVNTIKAGIFVIVLFALFVSFTFLLGRENSAFESKTSIYTTMSNAQSLKDGAAVKLKGIKVGSIDSIEIENLDQIKITMTIMVKYLEWIKKDSHISVKTQGVLGDKFIEILGGSAQSQSIEALGFIKTKKGKEISDFINRGDDILQTSNRVLSKFEVLIDQIIEEDRIGTLLESMTKTSNRMNAVFSPALMKDVKSLTKGLAATSTRIQEGPGTLHSLVFDDTVHEDLQSLLGGAKRNKILKYFIRESIKKSEKIKE